MFAHIDAPANRFLRGDAIGEDGEPIVVLPPAELAGDVERSTVIPTQHNLSALAAAWLALEPDLDLRTIEVLRTAYDADDAELTMEEVATFDVPARGDR
jgi:hypothetical protein